MKFSIERRRRTPWDWRLIMWPCVALVLSLYLWARPLPSRPIVEPFERAVGIQRDGTVFLCERGGRPDVVESCVFFKR